MSRLGILVALIAVLLAVLGCGAEDDSTARDDTSSADPTGSGQPTDDAGPSADDVQVVEVITRPAAGGEVATTPTLIGDRLSLLRYTAAFRGNGPQGDALADAITRSAQQYRAQRGRSLAAAVVQVGCGQPAASDVRVEVAGGSVQVSAPADAAKVECVVALTSVVLLDVPAGLLPRDPGQLRTADTASPGA